MADWAYLPYTALMVEKAPSYRDGIVEALGQGMITYVQKGRIVDKPGTHDIYDASTHISGMNARELNEGGRELVRLFTACRMVTRMLAIGAGSGRECAEAHDIAPDRIVVDTVSHSPVNPWVRLPGSHRAVRRTIEALRARLNGVAIPKTPKNMSFDFVMRVQQLLNDSGNTGTELVRHEPTAFIRHQCIGTFPQDFVPPDEQTPEILAPRTYQLVYDSHAAFLHAREGRPTIADGYRYTARDGVLCIEPGDGERLEEAIEFADACSLENRPTVVMQANMRNRTLLVARPRSRVAVAAAAMGEANPILVPDLEAFLRAIPRPADDDVEARV